MKKLIAILILILTILASCIPVNAGGITVSEEVKYHKVLPAQATIHGLKSYPNYEVVTWVLEGAIPAGDGGQIPFDADLVTHQFTEDSVILYIFWSFKSFTINPSGDIDTEMALYLSQGNGGISIPLAQDSWVLDTQTPTAHDRHSLTDVYIPMNPGLFAVALSGTNRNQNNTVHTVITVTIGFVSSE